MHSAKTSWHFLIVYTHYTYIYICMLLGKLIFSHQNYIRNHNHEVNKAIKI